jgi:ubiquinone/menaquinone biosynthesis C-methylase UbiE
VNETWNLRADAFAGAAEAYLRYRPPYPKVLLDDLLAQASVPAGGALLDLACGPGRVALDIAGSFATITAIDLEPEMIDVGKAEAARRGIGGVTWLVGRAEDAQLPANSLDLITIGEAFHRLDQQLIVERAREWLRPGGCIVTLGATGFLAGTEPWQKTVTDVAQRWMRRTFPTGLAAGRPGAETGPGASERVLSRAGYADVVSRDFSELRDWSLEQIVGFLASMSTCSKYALGAGFAAFEAELRSALTGEAGAPRFCEAWRCGYTLGRKANR